MKSKNPSHELNLRLFEAITGANPSLATKTLKSIEDPETLKAVLTAKDEDEYTPLHLALYKNNYESYIFKSE